jgi:hypothetical protein
MKKSLLFIAFVSLAFSVSFAQNKKEEKEAAAKVQFDKAIAAIEAKDFVIIVDSYETSNGTLETNSLDANFLSCEKEFVFLQGTMVAGNSYTNKCKISDYKQVTDKKGNIRVDIQFIGTFVTGKVEIYMKKGGNYADVVITPTKGAARRFSGEIIPRTESKYFKRPGEV